MAQIIFVYISPNFSIKSIHLFRCENAEAFEVQDGGKSTGIFTKYLNKHILQSVKITHVLEHVSEGKCAKKYLSHVVAVFRTS